MPVGRCAVTRYRVTAEMVVYRVSHPGITSIKPVAIFDAIKGAHLPADTTPECIRDLLAAGLIEPIEDL
jgi:hypothetical protein